jgi:hypothetical protein
LLLNCCITIPLEKRETSGLDNVSPETACADEASSVAELSSCDTLLISNLPENADDSLIEIYFESPKSGGCEGAIERIHFVDPKVAKVQFKDPQGKRYSRSESLIILMFYACNHINTSGCKCSSQTRSRS